MKIDLHCHSIFSDGTFTPEKLVDKAVELGLNAFSLTDHDTVEGYKIAKEYAKDKNIEVIPGVEINTTFQNKEVHVLGYYMNIEDAGFLKVLDKHKQARIQQVEKITDLLRQHTRLQVSVEDIQKHARYIIGRPHVVKAIVAAGGAHNIQEAYDKFIHNNAVTYPQRDSVSPHEAVEAIYEAGGIPVIAHPGDTEGMVEIIKELMCYGLRGLEVYHRRHTSPLIEYYSSLAEELGLIITGGSDCHGPRHEGGNYHLGKIMIPEWVYAGLMEEKYLIQQGHESNN